jgi:hypothetical protein
MPQTVYIYLCCAFIPTRGVSEVPECILCRRHQVGEHQQPCSISESPASFLVRAPRCRAKLGWLSLLYFVIMRVFTCIWARFTVLRYSHSYSRNPVVCHRIHSIIIILLLLLLLSCPLPLPRVTLLPPPDCFLSSGEPSTRLHTLSSPRHPSGAILIYIPSRHPAKDLTTGYVSTSSPASSNFRI